MENGMEKVVFLTCKMRIVDKTEPLLLSTDKIHGIDFSPPNHHLPKIYLPMTQTPKAMTRSPSIQQIKSWKNTRIDTQNLGWYHIWIFHLKLHSIIYISTSLISFTKRRYSNRNDGNSPN